MTVAQGETYGQIFRRLRKELGLSQPQAGEICGISKHTIAV